MPTDPPPGTPYATILSQYPHSVYAGLYLGAPSVCPPEPYSSIVQPQYPGYSLRSVSHMLTQPAPSGGGLVDRRIQVAFAPTAPTAPVSVAGWFLAVRLSDGTYQTMALEPFPGNVELTSPAAPLALNLHVSAAPTGAPAAQDVIQIQALPTVFQGGRMAFILNRDEREREKTILKALGNDLAADDAIPNLPKRSKKTRTPRWPATTLPLGIPVATWRDLAEAVKQHALDNLAALVPPPP